MNEILKQIKERKSVRIFQRKDIPPEVKEEILQSAFEAPTAGSMMLYTIIDITDQKLKDKLAVSCDNQMFIAEAPLVLIFLADYQKWYDMFLFSSCSPRKPGEGDLMLAISDALIAAQNTVLAAGSMGLGSCYIGDIMENCGKVRDMLDLPDYVFPAAMVVYGYPSENQKKRNKPVRFEKSYIVSENRYRKLKGEEISAYHDARNNKSGKINPETIEAFCKRKYMSDFSIEMNRSVSEYLKNFRNNT